MSRARSLSTGAVHSIGMALHPGNSNEADINFMISFFEHTQDFCAGMSEAYKAYKKEEFRRSSRPKKRRSLERSDRLTTSSSPARKRRKTTLEASSKKKKRSPKSSVSAAAKNKKRPRRVAAKKQPKRKPPAKRAAAPSTASPSSPRPKSLKEIAEQKKAELLHECGVEYIYKLRRPRTAWMLFCTAFHGQYLQQHPSSQLGERTILASTKWKEMHEDGAEKQKYVKQAAAERKAFLEAQAKLEEDGSFDRVSTAWKQLDVAAMTMKSTKSPKTRKSAKSKSAKTKSAKKALKKKANETLKSDKKRKARKSKTKGQSADSDSSFSGISDSDSESEMAAPKEKASGAAPKSPKKASAKKAADGDSKRDALGRPNVTTRSRARADPNFVMLEKLKIGTRPRKRMMATKMGSTSTKTVSTAPPRGPLPDLVQRMGGSSGDDAEREVDRLRDTLPPEEMEKLLMSQPMDLGPQSDDSLDLNALGVPPGPTPDGNHNTKRAVADDDDEDSDDSALGHFGV